MSGLNGTAANRKVLSLAVMLKDRLMDHAETSEAAKAAMAQLGRATHAASIADAIVESLVALAAEGNLEAIKEVLNRVDGKAVTKIEGSVEHRTIQIVGLDPDEAYGGVLLIASTPPDARVYRPRGAVRDLFSTTADEVLVVGPVGTGKTFGLLHYALGFAERFARSRIAFLRKERRSLNETVLTTWEEKVLPEGHPCLTGVSRGHRSVYIMPNKSRIILGGMDDPTKVMSGEYDLIMCFEATAFIEEDWESLTTRLRNGKAPYQQIVGDCNPGASGHWLNKRFHRGGARLLSQHKDNPMLFDHAKGDWTPIGAKYMQRLDALTGARRLRLRDGIWAAEEGICYPMFNPSRNVVKRFVDPDQDSWTHEWKEHIISCDDGCTNPFVAQVWGHDHDDRLHMFEEHAERELRISERAEVIREMAGRYGVHIVVIDPAAADLKKEVRRCGLTVVDARNDVFDGICRVQDRWIERADGFPGATVDPSCVAFLAEIEAYHWKKRRVHGSDQDRKDEPEKKDDHSMDATRYAIAHYDLRAEAGAAWVGGDDSGGAPDDDWGWDEL